MTDYREPWQMSPHEFTATPGSLSVPRGWILALRPEAVTAEGDPLPLFDSA